MQELSAVFISLHIEFYYNDGDVVTAVPREGRVAYASRRAEGVRLAPTVSQEV
jgi:hypothetical protein